MKSKDPEVEKLQNKIELYNMSIEDNANDPKPYSLKADALIKIGQITKESIYNKEALKLYNKAIELDSQNPIYFANRSKLHVEMGNPEMAVEDIKKVDNLPQSSNAMTAIYLKQTVSKVIAMNKVQNSMKKLQTAVKISDNPVKGSGAESAEGASNENNDRIEKEEKAQLSVTENTIEQNIDDSPHILGNSD